METVRRILDAGIPVIGHLGFTPQSIRRFGGPRVQARGEAEAASLLADARALAAAGCSAIVLEMVPAAVAAQVTRSVSPPTIGIGAGAGCAGQILVLYDVVGLSERRPRFARPYADLAQGMRDAVAAYARDVRAGTFPGPEHTHDGRSWGGPAEEAQR